MPFVLNSKSASGLLNLNVISGGSSGDPLIQNLLAYYSFDGNVLDITNQGNDFVNADIDNGLPCQFSSTYYKKGQSAGNFSQQDFATTRGNFDTATTFLDPTQPITIAGWFFFRKNIQSPVYIMLGNQNCFIPTIGWVNAGGNLPNGSSVLDDHIWGSSPTTLGNQAFSLSSGTVSQLTWYHLVLRSDPANSLVKLSVNAGTPTTATFTGAVDPYPVPLSMFDSQFNMPSQVVYGSGGVNEYLDEVGLWQRLLTDAEITTLYNGGTGKFYNAATNSFQ